MIALFLNSLLRRCELILAVFIIKINPTLNKQILFIKSTIKRNIFNLEDFPNQLLLSIILLEDKRYYSHIGIDNFSIGRALINNFSGKRIEGASTITQQLIRNITNEKEISLKRKFKEIILAILIESSFSKDELLSAYLNTYKFINQCNLFSFCLHENYNLHNLTIIESAEISARIKYISINKKNYLNYLKRVRKIEKILTAS